MTTKEIKTVNEEDDTASRLQAQLRQPSRVAILSAQATVQLRPVGFTIAWTGIYSLHAVCAVYFVLAAQLYMRLRGTTVSNVVQLYQLAVADVYFSSIATAHYAIAAIHIYSLVKPFVAGLYTFLIWAMCRNRKFDSLSRRVSTISSPSITLIYNARYSRARQLLAQAATARRKIFASDGFFGVRNPHFEIIFLTREIIETLLQTYQAYSMSRLLPRVWLNGFYTVILVVNCWTTPLLRRVYNYDLGLERLLTVLCDIVLDFVSSIAVPVIVAMTYFAVYDPETTDFNPWTLTYDDVWLINFINEAPIVLFSSWLDAASHFVFSLGLLLSIEDVKALITRHDVGTETKTRPWSLSSVLPENSAAIDWSLSKPRVNFSKWVHRVMVVWGFAVLGAYLDAFFRPAPAYCALELRPWFIRAPACGVVKINCAKHGISGSESDNNIFGNLNNESVEYVVYRHCPHIEISSRLLSFRSLYGIKTYNSTISRWDSDAALKQTAHPHTRFAFFVKTDFPSGTLPLGLLSPDFPPTLTDIEICVSNIQWLPKTLPWRVETIYLEYSQLDVFPIQLLELMPITISLAYNQISNFPREALATPRLARLALLGNPITQLPTEGVNTLPLLNRESGLRLYMISLEHTHISDLPDWATEEFINRIFFLIAATSICIDVVLNTSSLERNSQLAQRPWLTESCETEGGISGFYPLYVEKD